MEEMKSVPIRKHLLESMKLNIELEYGIIIVKKQVVSNEDQISELW